jgi:soluble lytic murein transglycosylase
VRFAGLGTSDLKPQHRSALVAALASASLLAFVNIAAAETASTSHGSKTTGKKSTASHSEDKKPASKHGAKAGKSEAKNVPVPRARPSKDDSAESAAASRRISPSRIPLAQAPPPEISDSDIAQVKRALETLRNNNVDDATKIEASISDPVARKLVEWVILRYSDNGAEASRYVAFITANPTWPSLTLFRRRAEAMLWVEDPNPAQVRNFFNGSPPVSARGRLVLARALAAQGDRPGAEAQVRQAWREEPFSGDVESQVVDDYGQVLSRADHKARMEKCLDLGESECALRAARRLGETQVAIARLRIALNKNSGKPTKLLEEVPAEAHHDPGYVLAKLQVLRRADKITEAGQLMLNAPHEADEIYNPEEWWVERRVLARKLLDVGEHKTAYLTMRDAVEPTKENSRVERQFMAGWIALRYLNEPAIAAKHFARIPEVSIHPTSLARAHYWLGRAAEAAHRPDEARAQYQAAARGSAAYYGQLARARLGMRDIELARPPISPAQRASAERLELVQALHILYALDERSLVIPLMADLGDKLDDPGVLAALGELAQQYGDPRGMLHLGKAALARGLPLDYYAFPTVGVPAYTPIGPQLDHAILFAIIRQESQFNPADWSAAQAMGLMQVTPVAAKDTCKRFSCTYDVNRLKNDIPYNLQVGAAELAGVIQDYRGNLMLAFAGYNAGRGRVKEWIERYGDPRDPRVDPIDWAERIPFMETRNYVQRVMENYQVYRTLLGEDAQLTIEADLRRGGRAEN